MRSSLATLPGAEPWCPEQCCGMCLSACWTWQTANCLGQRALWATSICLVPLPFRIQDLGTRLGLSCQVRDKTFQWSRTHAPGWLWQASVVCMLCCGLPDLLKAGSMYPGCQELTPPEITDCRSSQLCGNCTYRQNIWRLDWPLFRSENTGLPREFHGATCYLTLIVSCTGSRLTYEKMLGVSVGLFLDCVSPGGRETHTKCIQHHSMDSDPWLQKRHQHSSAPWLQMQCDHLPCVPTVLSSPHDRLHPSGISSQQWEE